MPEAWDQLRTGPDELLVELLSDAVEGLSGHRPDDEDVAQFLARAGLTPNAVGTEPLKPTPAEDQNQSAALGTKFYTGTTPASYSLFGERHNIAAYREILSAVCEAMYAAHPERFLESIFRLRGSKRPYFSKDPNVLRAPKALGDSGIYAEVHLSSNDMVRRCRTVLSLFGHDPDELTIEVQAD